MPEALISAWHRHISPYLAVVVHHNQQPMRLKTSSKTEGQGMRSPTRATFPLSM